MKNKVIPYDAKIPIKLSIHELEMIRNETFCDFNNFKFAVIGSRSVKIGLSLSEIEQWLS